MAARELAFCDGRVLFFWFIHRLANATNGRRLLPEISGDSQRIAAVIEGLRKDGIKIATTLPDAGDILTRLYKHESPFVGGQTSFLARKELAFEIGRSLSESVFLLSPQEEHFRVAFALWYELCDKQNREAFAGFSDYLDASLILAENSDFVVRHVLVEHSHLHFILNKKRSPASVQIHRVPNL